MGQSSVNAAREAREEWRELNRRARLDEVEEALVFPFGDIVVVARGSILCPVDDGETGGGAFIAPFDPLG